jgi:2-methylcitrate dehydratase PrpD
VLDGRVGLDSFADDEVRRPQAQALIEKVGRFSIPDEKSHNGLSGYNVIRVVTRGGTIEEKITGTPGAPDQAYSDEDRKQKFMSCALRAMDSAAAEALYGRVRAAATMGSIRELLR